MQQRSPRAVPAYPSPTMQHITVLDGSGGGIQDAPSDGHTYARMNASWIQPVSSFNARTGSVTLASVDVTTALAYAPYDAANPAGYQTATQLAAYVPLTARGTANGVATLDPAGRVPTAQLPASSTGTLNYKGGWNAATNTPAMTNGAQVGGVLAPNGDYYLVTVGATTGAIDGTTTWVAGDWISSNGAVWARVQNTTSPLISATTVAASSAFNLPLTSQADDGTGQPGYNIVAGMTQDIILSIAPGTGAITIGALSSPQFSSAKITATSSFNLPHSYTTDDGTGVLGFNILDDFRNIMFAVDANGVHAGTLNAITYNTVGAGGTVGFSAGEIADRNARALGYAGQIRGQVNTEAARPVWAYNHLILYGQSLSSGFEGWPSLSQTQPYDNLMIGTCIRPNSEAGTTWTQMGAAAFSPLVATVQDATTAALLTPAQQAALAAGDYAKGETVGEGATNFLRRLYLQDRAVLADPAKLFVTSSCGCGGMSVAQLSKGASPELFNRLRGCASLGKTLAGASYGVIGMLYLQGEKDYAGGTTAALYKTQLQQLYADFIADIATTIAGQARPPGMFTYQTNEAYTMDGVAIGEAQLELALSNRNWYLATPDYPVTDKGGHLDPNGYRWLGQQFGKVLYRVLIRNENWLPVYPIQITVRGTQVLVDFHVPEPPLVFDMPWVGTESSLMQTDYPNKGFSAVDDAGDLPVGGVSLVSDTQVLVTLVRTPSTNPKLIYADLTHSSGNGCLRDSDPMIADAPYSYTAGSGQYSFANIPALVGFPYALWNWCVAFNRPMTAG
jgi:hypothetical protein